MCWNVEPPKFYNPESPSLRNPGTVCTCLQIEFRNPLISKTNYADMKPDPGKYEISNSYAQVLILKHRNLDARKYRNHEVESLKHEILENPKLWNPNAPDSRISMWHETCEPQCKKTCNPVTYDNFIFVFPTPEINFQHRTSIIKHENLESPNHKIFETQ